MKKDYTRDYITQAFRKYAASTKQDNASLSPAEQEDIIAVEKTINCLERSGKEHIVMAVKAVYFQDPKLPIHKGDISFRVRKFSINFPVSEKQAYFWLREARLLCARFRGLSTP